MFAGCQITKYIIWQNNNSKCFFSYVYHRPPTWLMNVGVEEGSETQLVQKRPTMHPGNHPVKAVKRQFVLSSFWWDVSSSLYPQVDYESKTCLILRIFMLSSLPLYFKVCVCVCGNNSLLFQHTGWRTLACDSLGEETECWSPHPNQTFQKLSHRQSDVTQSLDYYHWHFNAGKTFYLLMFSSISASH